MPNTPSLIGNGAGAFSMCDNSLENDRLIVKDFMESVGIAYELPERLMDAVTGLSGSGPAFVFMFIEALSDGGVK
jgi:pyrroline-5-carboxylate reductase